MEFIIVGFHDLHITRASYIKGNMEGFNLRIDTSIKCFIYMMDSSHQITLGSGRVPNCHIDNSSSRIMII